MVKRWLDIEKQGITRNLYGSVIFYCNFRVKVYISSKLLAAMGAEEVLCQNK